MDSELYIDDIITIIFRLKQKKLISILKDGEVFGRVRYRMHKVEWQKIGLPHAHIILWLYEKIHASKIDTFLSAEIPDHSLDPELYEIIKRNMIHGPCGMLNSKSM